LSVNCCFCVELTTWSRTRQ